MSRGAVRALALAALAAVAAILGAATARAASPAGEAAAAAIRARLGPVSGAAADREAVLGAWEVAGARLDGLRADLAASPATGGLDRTVLAFSDLCTGDLPHLTDASDAGDLLLYRDATVPGSPTWRLAMVTDWSSVVVLDAGAGRLEEVARARLLDDVPAAGDRRLAAAGSLRACRPSGAPPEPAAHRHIAIVDAASAVAAVRWELDHPRDADTGALHRLGRVVLTPLALAAEGTSALLGAAGRLATGLLGHLGPAAALGRLLGATFDGRGLHAALTEGLLDWPLGPIATVLRHLPVIGDAVLRPLRGTASFTVGLLTGVDDSPHVPAGGVLLSLACDLLVVARPLAVAGRLIGLRRALDLSSHASDLLSGRPSSLLRLGGAAAHRPVHDVLDAASLLVRPSSVPGHLVELSGRLARWGANAAAPTATSPAAERALAAALHHLDPEHLHHIERVAELSHLHSGARTLTAAATNQLQPFPTPAPTPPPTPLHLPSPAP